LFTYYYLLYFIYLLIIHYLFRHVSPTPPILHLFACYLVTSYSFTDYMIIFFLVRHVSPTRPTVYLVLYYLVHDLEKKKRWEGGAGETGFFVEGSLNKKKSE
jgi:hypothetical protein